MAAPRPVLLTPGFAADRGERLAAACGLAAEPGAARTNSPVILVLGGDGIDLNAADLWAPPRFAWIEAGGLADCALEAIIRRAIATDVFTSFTTATANELHLAGRIVAGIAARRPLPDGVRDDLELAIHEAISNALVHGNLLVEGMKGLSMAALDRFSSDLASRMADPAYATRRVEVSAVFAGDTVSVDVADEGAGFSRTRPAGHGASGRGLDLIASIAVGCELLDGGCRIRMRFAL